MVSQASHRISRKMHTDFDRKGLPPREWPGKRFRSPGTTFSPSGARSRYAATQGRSQGFPMRSGFGAIAANAMQSQAYTLKDFDCRNGYGPELQPGTARRLSLWPTSGRAARTPLHPSDLAVINDLLGGSRVTDALRMPRPFVLPSLGTPNSLDLARNEDSGSARMRMWIR